MIHFSNLSLQNVVKFKLVCIVNVCILQLVTHFVNPRSWNVSLYSLKMTLCWRFI